MCWHQYHNYFILFPQVGHIEGDPSRSGTFPANYVHKLTDWKDRELEKYWLVVVELTRHGMLTGNYYCIAHWILSGGGRWNHILLDFSHMLDSLKIFPLEKKLVKGYPRIWKALFLWHIRLHAIILEANKGTEGFYRLSIRAQPCLSCYFFFFELHHVSSVVLNKEPVKCANVFEVAVPFNHLWLVVLFELLEWSRICT